MTTDNLPPLSHISKIIGQYDVILRKAKEISWHYRYDGGENASIDGESVYVEGEDVIFYWRLEDGGALDVRFPLALLAMSEAELEAYQEAEFQKRHGRP